MRLREHLCGRIITLSLDEILCVGSKSVVSMNLTTCVLKKEADMCEERSDPGVIRSYDFVYVFGGAYHTKSSEKFSYIQGNWKKLPDMDSPRSKFTPALYNNDIYLCDTYTRDDYTTTRSPVSSFNIITETYTVYSVTIPTLFANPSVAFIDGGKLYVVMNPKKLFWWRVGSSLPFNVVRNQKNVLEGNSCTEVLQVERSVYWTDYMTKRVVKFDLDTLEYDNCT